jgi:hypothetical protein
MTQPTHVRSTTAAQQLPLQQQLQAQTAPVIDAFAHTMPLPRSAHAHAHTAPAPIQVNANPQQQQQEQQKQRPQQQQPPPRRASVTNVAAVSSSSPNAALDTSVNTSAVNTSVSIEVFRPSPLVDKEELKRRIRASEATMAL